jgi:hypothetical protein
VLPFGECGASLSRRSRRHLRQSPDRDGKGEHPHRYSVLGSQFVATMQPAAGAQPRHRALDTQRYRPSRLEDSMPRRAMRGMMPARAQPAAQVGKS